MSSTASSPPSSSSQTTDIEASQKEKEQLPPDDKNAFKVEWSHSDPLNPHNFSTLRKYWLTSQFALLAFVGSFGASIISPAQGVIVERFHISAEASVLTVSLFVLGYAVGPMIWAPIGEVYGRKISMVPPVFILGLFSIATAVSNNAAAILVTRFFGGLFASAPNANASAAIGDFFDARSRGVPMSLMALCIVGGPCLAPVDGSALVVNPHLGWRWTMYIQAIISFAASVITAVLLPETYGPVLLKRKAVKLRRDTNDERYWHPHESERMDLSKLLAKYISRPARMLLTEPIVTCIALYASFVYGLLFFQLESFPIVFYQQRHYSLVVSTLPLLGLFVGVSFALVINIANQPMYAKAVKKNGGKPVPEARLPPMIIGGIMFSSGMFWFGWTAALRYSWVLPTVAGALIGGGFNIVFQQCLNYLADSYGPLAASSMAANTFMRSIMACALPLAAKPLFGNIGVGPGCSLLGGISCLALPVPFLFMKYGPKLRSKSAFALKD